MKNLPVSPNQGYYRFPALYNDVIVFTAEGDLWLVKAKGGMAQRLTTHHGLESHAAISPDGATIAFSAEYDGPTEVYSMPMSGGRPTRHTYEGESARVVNWTPDGKILYATRHFSTLPNTQLATIDPISGDHNLLPLHQASTGSLTADGKNLFFARLPRQGSDCKRYMGGSVENLWSFSFSKRKKNKEAVPLTSDYLGTSKDPMHWEGRVYFASDRDGTMNIWSISEKGRKPQQHTYHSGWDIKSPSLHSGRIVYQCGADLYLYDIAKDRTKLVPITLASDFDQTRERWLEHPLRYLDSWDLSPTGDRLTLTARGRMFVFPAKQGRRVEVSRKQGVHYRNAMFLPNGNSLVALSDESGEMEFWRLPANGVGEGEALTSDSTGFRFGGELSPDGKWLVYDTRHNELWLLNLESNEHKRIRTADSMLSGLRWSPDSQWIAYATDAANKNSQVWIYSLADDSHTPVTSDRVDSMKPAWSPDGKWLYFVSHRTFHSVVDGVWGSRQPEPYFEQTSRVYMLALQSGLRSPFQPADELGGLEEEKADAKEKSGEMTGAEEKGEDKKGEDKKAGDKKAVRIDLNGIQNRLYEVPIPTGTYWGLVVTDKYIYWGERSLGRNGKNHLKSLEIKNQDLEIQTIFSDIRGFSLSADTKKIAVRRRNAFYVFDVNGESPKNIDKLRVRLNNWKIAIEPQEEWRQMLTEAWRLERDYFYDPNMHGVDWDAQLERHLPLVDRIRDRHELDDLIAHMISELSALHTDIRGGDKRRGTEYISVASLGARLELTKSGGYRIDHIYRSDPDYLCGRGPLERPDLGICDGDIIESINGLETSATMHPALLLKDQVGKQVLLKIRSGGADSDSERVAKTGAKAEAKGEAKTKAREVVVEPIASWQAIDLRYGAWEYERRLRVDEKSNGEIGYVHLRAMSSANYTEWVRNFYPVFNRNGLIVDVRHNTGGNIDSWILEKLIRRAWAFWQPRSGKPYWNMQYAFRGHLVVLCNEKTASDGETLSEGIRRLGLGQVLGTRTWGGGIWLSHNTHLVDDGLTRTAQNAVFTPEGEWAIEGHGIDPDIVVDNLPHATFNGEDAQLDAAVDLLLKQIEEEPIPEPTAPAYPDKSFQYPQIKYP